MNTSDRRPQACQIGRAPTWTEKYRLGVLLNKQMDPVCTLEEVAAELGITKQNAYTETVLALGALAWTLRNRLPLIA